MFPTVNFNLKLVSFFFVFFTTAATSCFAQEVKSKEAILLDIASIKNSIDQTSSIEKLIEQDYFKDKTAFFNYAESRFNNYYQKQDTLNTLKAFNLLADRWIRKGKMDSVLTDRPIKPLLKNNLPIGLQAQTQVMLFGYEKSMKNIDDATILNYKGALDKFEKLNDSTYSAWATLHGELVVHAAKSNDFSTIMNHVFGAMDLLRFQNNSEGLRDIEGIISTLYSLNFLFEPAKVLRDEKIAHCLKTKDYSSLIIENLNAALDEKLQENYTIELFHLNEAVKYAEIFKVNHFKFITYHAYIVHASQQNKKEDVAQFFKLMEVIYPEFEGSIFHKILFQEAQAYNELSLGNFKQAEEFALSKLELAERFNSKEIVQESHQLLFSIYNNSGQKDKAIDQENDVLKYLNKTKEGALKNQIIYYQTIFETEKRDLKIQSQEKDIELLEEREKVRTQWYIIGIVVVLGLFGILWLLRSRNFARGKQKMQESFTKDILKTQENERARIASELHDSVGQKLLILKNSLSTSDNQQTKEIELVGETIKEVREMSHNLHPFQFEKLGLQQSLINMVETFQKNSNIFYSEDLEIPENYIKKDQEIYIFRMLQEAITNVEKHSDAVACNLSTVVERDYLVFTLKDNGTGFETSKTVEGLGMKTLQERAKFIDAQLQIDSTPSKGTTITLKIAKK